MQRLWYYYDGNGICGIEYNGSVYYFQKNLQGDVTRVYDGNGSLVAQYVYDAWGNHKVLNANGTEITDESFIGNVNPIRYRGYYYDTDSGLYYLQSRYYDPEVGRFINADDIDYIEPETLMGCNLYAYCGNNPVMYSDPSGHVGILASILIAAAIGGTIGAVSGGIAAYQNGRSIIWGAFCGFFTGAFMGASFPFGAAVLSGGLAISAVAALGITVGVNMAVSAGAYFIEAGVNNEEIDWKDFALTIIGAGVESAVSFGLGALLGATRLWQFNKQSAMRGLKKGWYRLNFSQKTDRILNFVGSGIWNLIKGPGLRTLYKNTFLSPIKSIFDMLGNWDVIWG